MNFLDNFNSLQALTPRGYTSGTGGSHVFLELLTHFRPSLSTEEHMALFYFHSLCEKSIAYWRNRDFNSASIPFKKVNEIDRTSFPENVKEGVETIYLACAAYGDYVENRYDEAAGKIEKAVLHSIKQKDTMPDFIKSMYEHNLNLLRIHIRTRDKEKIVSLFSDLLNSLFFSINDSITLTPAIATMDEDQRLGWLHYILNNVVYSVQRTFENDDDTATAIFLDTLNNVFTGKPQAHSYAEKIQDSLKVIHKLLKREEDSYIQDLNEKFESITHSPNFVKKLILSSYIHWSELKGGDLSAHHNYSNFRKICANFGIDLPGTVTLKQAV